MHQLTLCDHDLNITTIEPTMLPNETNFLSNSSTSAFILRLAFQTGR
jgi:hypothetical protein